MAGKVHIGMDRTGLDAAQADRDSHADVVTGRIQTALDAGRTLKEAVRESFTCPDEWSVKEGMTEADYQRVRLDRDRLQEATANLRAELLRERNETDTAE